MNRTIKHIRTNIIKRKKKRLETKSNPTWVNKQQIFPKDSEKHLSYPLGTELISHETTAYPPFQRIIVKSVIAFAIFFLSIIIFRAETPNLLGIKNSANYLLNEEFPFAKVHSWYAETFGSPIAKYDGDKPALENNYLPLSGEIQETFAANGKGILIEPNQETVVQAIDDGVILFAGKKKNQGKTVIIQHSDLSKTTYSQLTNINVYPYQTIKAKDIIGNFIPNNDLNTVYFSVEKNNQYIDPHQVIPVDDVP